MTELRRILVSVSVGVVLVWFIVFVPLIDFFWPLRNKEIILISEITVNSFFSHLKLCTFQRLKNTLAIDFVQIEGQLDI